MLARPAILVALVLCTGMASGAVYHEERNDQLILGNDEVEVRFSVVDGALSSLQRKAGRSWISQPATVPFAFSLDLDTNSVWTAQEGRWCWPPGHVLTDHSFEAGPTQVSLTLTWMDAATIRIAVTLVVEIDDGSPWIRFRFRVENKRTAGVVTQFWGPLLLQLSLPPAPTVVWPALRGEIHRAFSGFLEETYPRMASMQWFWVGDATEGLYYGVHDTTLRYKQLRFGAERELNGRIAASARTWCFVPPSRVFVGPEVIVGPHRGDWHVAAGRYRQFVLDAGWDHAPPTWVRSLRGWSNLWVKSAAQVLENDYTKIPERLLAIDSRKIDLLDVFGWHRNGFDTYYPDYIPLADAGGDAGLRSALSASHTHGDRVMLYFNSRVAHPESIWHQANPTAANAVDHAGDPIREFYNGFSFFVECPSSPLWRDKLKSSVAEAVARGSDGAWVDQLGGAGPYLCYASSHGHADPALAFAGNRTLARDLRDAMGGNRILTCEGELDALGGEVDIFGTFWFYPFGYKEADAPEVLRYTLPGKLVGLKAEGASWGTAAYHAVAFVLGCPLLDDNHGAMGFLAIYDSAPECFYRGRFLDTVGLSVSPGSLVAKLHLAEDRGGLCVAVWNGATRSLDGDVSVDLEALSFVVGGKTPVEALELPSRKSVPFTWDGTRVRYAARFGGSAGGAHLISLAVGPRFRRGDTNCDGVLDISDPVATLGFLFLGGVKLACKIAADATGDGDLDLSDAVFALNFLFLGSRAPPPPFPDCGVDPLPGSLSCAMPCGCLIEGA